MIHELHADQCCSFIVMCFQHFCVIVTHSRACNQLHINNILHLMYFLIYFSINKSTSSLLPLLKIECM